MNVLRSNADFIGCCAPPEHLAISLVAEGLISEEDLATVRSEQTNLDAYNKLLDIIENGDNVADTAYFLCDVIRSSYPNISGNLPELQLGIRLLMPLTPGDKVVTIALFGAKLMIDICRHRVSSIFIIDSIACK